MKDLPVRKSIRLKDYNYSSNGAYFITVCVKDRHEMLGRIIVGSDALGAPVVELSEYGEFVKKEIEATTSHYAGVEIDKFIVMPNHVHMIIMVGRDGAPRASRPTTALIPTIVTALKKKMIKAFGFDLWQTSYHDHIIRNEEDYQNHWRYIDENPARWTEDEYYG